MKKTLTIFLISAIIGGFVGFLAASISLSIDIPSKFTGLSTAANIFIIICTYLLAVSFHELGHAYSFSRNGINMRAVLIIFFLFIKEKGRWQIRFRPNNVTALGGIAVPDLEPVRNESELIKMQSGYAKALIAGPIASVILWCIVTLSSILIILNTSNVTLSSVLFTVIISLTFITLFFLVTSLIKNEIVIGDFPAYKLAKKNRFFVAMQVYQYALFSSKHEQVTNENSHFLRNFLINGLQEKLGKQDTHIYTIALVDNFITEYFSGRLNELPQVVWDYADFLWRNPEELSKLKKSEVALSIYFHLLRLMYTKEDSKEKALELYMNLKEEVKPKTPMRKYLFKQTDHAFGIADNSDFLLNKENICISPAHGIWKNFEGYYVDEMEINKSLVHSTEKIV
ncbi:hypothetical protein GCM10011351_07340 [Paraliobacillus quinghaiensis]|uniref:Peptidase M50 domain-containing protein n=1 Tax=Paraliobacillus quinghaiensis TaxID=470815 RepID=A0A917TIU1_9BACI|nr:M50 family metallopeptidase [Paraliobacillus quinghaiensis]GGM24114.1 hypothetical protein GCM10011351_07340 [Paraliobacillus quinghaiensis]